MQHFGKSNRFGVPASKERFRQRIGTLLKRASISLMARNEAGSNVGVCFGITDFADWLFITDLGAVRECAGQGIGTALVRKLHELADNEENTRKPKFPGAVLVRRKGLEPPTY